MNRHAFRGSKTNRDRRDASFARAIRVLATIAPDNDQPIGTCPFCGDTFHDDSEGRWHADANCIGGDERFAS